MLHTTATIAKAFLCDGAIARITKNSKIVVNVYGNTITVHQLAPMPKIL